MSEGDGIAIPKANSYNQRWREPGTDNVCTQYYRFFSSAIYFYTLVRSAVSFACQYPSMCVKVEFFFRHFASRTEKNKNHGKSRENFFHGSRPLSKPSESDLLRSRDTGHAPLPKQKPNHRLWLKKQYQHFNTFFIRFFFPNTSEEHLHHLVFTVAWRFSVDHDHKHVLHTRESSPNGLATAIRSETQRTRSTGIWTRTQVIVPRPPCCILEDSTLSWVDGSRPSDKPSAWC